MYTHIMMALRAPAHLQRTFSAVKAEDGSCQFTLSSPTSPSFRYPASDRLNTPDPDNNRGHRTWTFHPANHSLHAQHNAAAIIRITSYLRTVQAWSRWPHTKQTQTKLTTFKLSFNKNNRDVIYSDKHLDWSFGDI